MKPRSSRTHRESSPVHLTWILPPQGSAQTLTFSMTTTLTFSMPIDKPREARSAVRWEAQRCRAAHVLQEPERQLMPRAPASMDTGITSAVGWINLTTLLLRRSPRWSCRPSRLGDPRGSFYGFHPRDVSIRLGPAFAGKSPTDARNSRRSESPCPMVGGPISAVSTTQEWAMPRGFQRVSNDNPHSEAQFKTPKTTRAFRAGSPTSRMRRTFAAPSSNGHNIEHRHGGIGLAHAPAGPPRPRPRGDRAPGGRCWPQPTSPGPTASWVARRRPPNSRTRSGSTAHSPSRRPTPQDRPPPGKRRAHQTESASVSQSLAGSGRGGRVHRSQCSPRVYLLKGDRAQHKNHRVRVGLSSAEARRSTPELVPLARGSCGVTVDPWLSGLRHCPAHRPDSSKRRQAHNPPARPPPFRT